MKKNCGMAAGLLVCVATAAAQRVLGAVPDNYTVLQDTDFFGTNVGHTQHASTFEDCAQACWDNPSCMCVSWNGPNSGYHDLACNLHCSTAGKKADKGELAAVIRPHMAPCHGPSPHPPPAPPAPPAPAGPIPAAWTARERAANMYIAQNEPMVVGNGYVAGMTHTGIMNVAGVFTGDLTTGRAEPVRAAIPSFWDGYQIGGYGGDYAAGLDVGESAVYSVGAMPGQASVVARKFAHRGTPHVIAVDFTFNNSASTMPIASNISLPVSWGSAAAAISTKGTVWAHDPASAAPGMACWTGKVMESEDSSLPLINLALCCTDLRTAPLDVSIPAGQTKTYSVVGVLYSTLDHASPVTLAAKGFAAAAGLTTEARWASHVAAVDSVLGSGIEIRGNHDLAKLVNASLHMLVASLRPEPEYWYSSSPGGLATNCYNGHTFWDMETWMYPNLLFFHPDLALGTVMYRVKGLRYAEQWANLTGRAGARYPWQTAGTGKVASYANEEEIHIVGDVALSMWQYYAATQNATWLDDHGLDVLSATADFFAAWAEPNVDGSFSLKKTQGPDEFHTGDDSCYVNAAAALTLRFAANFSAALGRPHPANWTEIAAKVRLPFDEARQRHLEFAQWTDKMVCKQADTIMLSYPIGVDMPPAVRKNDLDYYAAHTGNGPSMTWSMYLVGYLEIGQMDEAAAFFNKSWIPFVDKKTGNFGGDCGGNFLTGAGGFLQGLWAGWAGMRLRIDSLDFITPRVPTTTTGLKLRGASYLNSRFDLDLSGGKVCFRGWPAAPGGTALRIGLLGSGSFAPLTANPTCFDVETSVRMVGARGQA